MATAGRTTAATAAMLAVLLLDAASPLADGGSGFDPSLESNARNRPVRNAGPNDPRIYRNPEQKAAEFGYDNLNQAAFLLFFDKTTRFNPFSGRSEPDKITYLQAPVVPKGNEYTATPAGRWAFDEAFGYFEAKYEQERLERKKRNALEAGKADAAAQPTKAVPAKLAPPSDDVGTSVSFRWSKSTSLSLQAEYRNWSDNYGLTLNEIRYTVHPFGLSHLRAWGADADARPATPQQAEKEDGLRPETQTRDEIGKGNILFEIDLKQLFSGGGTTRLDPPTPGLLDDATAWDSFESQLKAGGWSGTLDFGTSAIKPHYYFTPTPAQETIPNGKPVDSFSYDLDFRRRDGMTVPMRRVWIALDTPAANELPVQQYRLGFRFDY